MHLNESWARVICLITLPVISSCCSRWHVAIRQPSATRILINSVEPPLNRQGGRFEESVTRYLQVRNEWPDPTLEEMIHEIWENTPDDGNN